MAIDDQHLAMMTLTNKSVALDKVTTQLKNKLNGDFNHDAPLQQRLASIHTEQSLISSRLAAISSNQPFTAPEDQDINDLGQAISALDKDVKQNAGLNILIADATNIMQQYGGNSSLVPPKAEGA